MKQLDETSDGRTRRNEPMTPAAARDAYAQLTHRATRALLGGVQGAALVLRGRFGISVDPSAVAMTAFARVMQGDAPWAPARGPLVAHVGTLAWQELVRLAHTHAVDYARATYTSVSHARIAALAALAALDAARLLGDSLRLVSPEAAIELHFAMREGLAAATVAAGARRRGRPPSTARAMVLGLPARSAATKRAPRSLRPRAAVKDTAETIAASESPEPGPRALPATTMTVALRKPRQGRPRRRSHWMERAQ